MTIDKFYGTADDHKACGKEQTVGEGDDAWKYTPTCAFGTV